MWYVCSSSCFLSINNTNTTLGVPLLHIVLNFSFFLFLFQQDLLRHLLTLSFPFFFSVNTSTHQWFINLLFPPLVTMGVFTLLQTLLHYVSSFCVVVGWQPGSFFGTVESLLREGPSLFSFSTMFTLLFNEFCDNICDETCIDMVLWIMTVFFNLFLIT